MALLLGLGAVLLFPAGAAAASQGPVAAYSFDAGEGTVVEDLTGNEHTGTIEKATWADGKYGSSLEFPDEGCVTVPDSEDLGLGEEFTIEAWVKPHYLETDPIIFKESEGFFSYGLDIGIGHYGKPEGAIVQGGEEVEAVVGSKSLEEHVWQHLAATYDGAHLRIYLGGELVGTRAIPGADLSSGGPLYIGCDGALGEHFEGRIDEVRIYQRALQVGEVQASMEEPLQTPKVGPVAAYSFDESEGSTVEDITGDAHEGTIEGGATRAAGGGKYGSSLEFPDEGCVTVPNSEDLGLGEEFTIEAWVKPHYLETDPIIFKEAEGFFSYGSTSASGITAIPKGRSSRAAKKWKRWWVRNRSKNTSGSTSPPPTTAPT